MGDRSAWNYIRFCFRFKRSETTWRPYGAESQQHYPRLRLSCSFVIFQNLRNFGATTIQKKPTYQVSSTQLNSMKPLELIMLTILPIERTLGQSRSNIITPYASRFPEKH